MAEIGPGDLSAAALDRFGDDDVAQDAIDAVLTAARAHCGWHVSPEIEDAEITLDGPGGGVLDLPTGRLTALTGVVEDGVERDVTSLAWSRNGSVRKRSGGRWSGTYRSIEVTITHGYPEVEAADWRAAIIAMVTEVSYSAVDTSSGDTSGALKRKKVDDVEYEWSDQALAQAAASAVYSVESTLDRYRLPEVLFA